MLLNRRIVVGICGGIASYKAVELVSRLQQAGALVDVIMSERAEEFVRPLTFSTMSHRPVYSDLWEPSGEAAEIHIQLAEAAELLIVVPATANTLAKLAHGIADNMLTAVALATRAPVVLAPAMHHHMYTHPATQANLELLRARGVFLLEPEVGRLASGEVGIGRLPETPVLLGVISVVLGRDGDLAGRRVVVTAGGTQEPIDPVRYVGNRSSGKMGYAIASVARDRGAQVTLISGPVSLEAPYGVKVIRVGTALQMRDAVVDAAKEADVLIMSAAVADYRPAQVAAQKLKKEGSGDAQVYKMGDEFSLQLTRTPDILGELAILFDKRSGEFKPQHPFIRVGFAAETNDLIRYARAKLAAKHLDLLVANDVSRSDSGFGSDTNRVLLFSADGKMEDLPLLSKTEVAERIWDRVVPLLLAADVRSHQGD
ncbi:MAG TPA: bifunctional phosphopantothenoylcysteine decarboxylase/phosphopantothenate--cysteine ligase CoaBC [Ktedonobacteraceae bacterium]|nr:bifunctional phosphopantothenoylcysteine decarboxylase/phosphopantothenate--cysteine ligase CoaBC [Ktedonobacteraceae bacterium]